MGAFDFLFKKPKEQKQVNGTLWGRTDKGWICMDYVK